MRNASSRRSTKSWYDAMSNWMYSQMITAVFLKRVMPLVLVLPESTRKSSFELAWRRYTDEYTKETRHRSMALQTSSLPWNEETVFCITANNCSDLCFVSPLNSHSVSNRMPYERVSVQESLTPRRSLNSFTS